MMRPILATLAVIFVVLVQPAGAESIRFGVQFAPVDVSYEELADVFRYVEKLGYDDVWLNDHFIPARGDENAPHLESWTLLAALARDTERIRLGILVGGNTYRHPAVLAKMATTIDHVSGGRLNFGLGAGWQESEHRAYGIPFYTEKERADRLGEALRLIRLLWTEDHPTWEGEFYELENAPFFPKPVQKPHPPIVVGGQGKKWIMPSVARYADEWNVSVGVSPDGIRERLEIVRRECERVGREPCVREVSVFLPLLNMSRIPLAGPVSRLGARIVAGEEIARSVLAGSPEAIRETIQGYVDAGATAVIITTRPGIDRELIRRFAEEIVPSFRESPQR